MLISVSAFAGQNRKCPSWESIRPLPNSEPKRGHQTATSERSGQRTIGDFMRGLLIERRNAVTRCVVAPGMALLIGVGGAIAQSGDLRAQDQSAKPAAANTAAPATADAERRRQGQPAQGRRIRRSRAGDQRPRRQSGMRLARPARGRPDVARRPRHRLPSPRSVRPFRLPGRPCPGHLPLPGAVRRHRSESAGQPERSRPCLLDQSECAAAGGGIGCVCDARCRSGQRPPRPRRACTGRRNSLRRRNDQRNFAV